MKYEIRNVDEAKKIMQITTVDERWYVKEDDKGNREFVPSVTWIAGHYPKGINFYKWLAQKGWDESQALLEAAGEKGSKVHNAVKLLIDGNTIKIDSKIAAKGEEPQELTTEEYMAIMSFASWWKIAKPIPIRTEFVVWGRGYAGTVDFLCKIKGETWLIDFKTSQNIWASHEIQVSAYKEALKPAPEIKLGILQLGYRRTKLKYKFTEIEDKYDLFLAAKRIWQNDQAGVEPKQKDYPLELKL